MRGEINARVDGVLGRLAKGDMTPGTPSNPSLVRQPPSYQRMHSNDSGSGKGSDKEMNGLRDWLDGPPASVVVSNNNNNNNTNNPTPLPRFYKSSSPSRNWIMTPHTNITTNNKYHPRGLPPQYPIRRGSNTPISPLAAKPSQTPNRSRSLDGLLDSEPAAAKNTALIEQIPSNATQSCDELDTTKTNDDEDDDNEKVVEQSLANANDMDKVSVKSNSSEKRKRNFMDRCVNKVRSFIRKWFAELNVFIVGILYKSLDLCKMFYILMCFNMLYVLN